MKENDLLLAFHAGIYTEEVAAAIAAYTAEKAPLYQGVTLEEAEELAALDWFASQPATAKFF